jgi:regulator of replication initiation timing
MDKELTSLALKIQQAAERCHRLRTENQNLRQELANSQQQAKLLQMRFEAAKNRLNAVIDKLPATDNHTSEAASS